MSHAILNEDGHNHQRTDGGPELVDKEHDRWYPDCPLTEHVPDSFDGASAENL